MNAAVKDLISNLIKPPFTSVAPISMTPRTPMSIRLFAAWTLMLGVIGLNATETSSPVTAAAPTAAAQPPAAPAPAATAPATQPAAAPAPVAAAPKPAAPVATVNFIRDVQPVLESRCLECHNPDKVKGGLLMHTADALLKGGDSGSSLVAPGKPDQSELLKRLLLPDGPR
jgi:hypothetical protein